MFSLSAPAAPTVPGAIEGRVVFEETPSGEELRVGDALIYLRGEGLTGAGTGAGAGADPPRLDQIDYTFVPRVLPVLAGETVVFRNSDDELHNIHTYSKGRRRNRNFNEAQPPGSVFSTTFPRPDSLLVLCDIHSHMMAHILILPNRYFAAPEEDGSFALASVPPGHYELVAWHEFYATVVLEVEVLDGETADVTVVLDTPIIGG